MDQFLSSIEKKALRITQIAVGGLDEALDIVQDAMFKLVQKYHHKNEDEWPALFYKILNSRISDWYRQQKLKNRWFIRRHSGKDDSNEDGHFDPIAETRDHDGNQPDQKLEFQESVTSLDQAIGLLPPRQQQAFLLRVWESLSVRETARAMGCTQGSVKTHCSRAIEKLRQVLKIEI